MIDKTTVKNVDLSKYLGTWYEIARYDHSFERGLVGVSATYSLRPDGKIDVLNQGHKHHLKGKLKKAHGKAKIPNESDPAKLKVSFFWIFYSDYYILDLDKDYQWVIVGSSSDKYLWILSRTPQMEGKLFEKMLDKVKKRGYHTSTLLVIPQFKNEDVE
jgi:lipocalin